jgi:hypothetical protein
VKFEQIIKDKKIEVFGEVGQGDIFYNNAARFLKLKK